MQSVQSTRPMFATVCANNVNRSVAVHEILHAAGLRVCSYGAGRQVIFPGRTSSDLRTFRFLTPYTTMYNALKKENAALFRENGVLEILERDISIKKAPERWQNLSKKQLASINIVICLDYAMFLTVLEDIQKRIQSHDTIKQLHLICLDTKDTPEDAMTSGKRVLHLCHKLNVPLDELTEEYVKSVVEEFEKEHHQQLSYLGFHM